MKLFQT